MPAAPVTPEMKMVPDATVGVAENWMVPPAAPDSMVVLVTGPSVKVPIAMVPILVLEVYAAEKLEIDAYKMPGVGGGATVPSSASSTAL